MVYYFSAFTNIPGTYITLITHLILFNYNDQTIKRSIKTNIEIEEVDLLGGVGGEDLYAVRAVGEAGDAVRVTFEERCGEPTHHTGQITPARVVTCMKQLLSVIFISYILTSRCMYIYILLHIYIHVYIYNSKGRIRTKHRRISSISQVRFYARHCL